MLYAEPQAGSCEYQISELLIGQRAVLNNGKYLKKYFCTNQKIEPVPKRIKLNSSLKVVFLYWDTELKEFDSNWHVCYIAAVLNKNLYGLIFEKATN